MAAYIIVKYSIELNKSIPILSPFFRPRALNFLAYEVISSENSIKFNALLSTVRQLF